MEAYEVNLSILIRHTYEITGPVSRMYYFSDCWRVEVNIFLIELIE